ncbi:MAG: hypothetical protein HIU84_11705 [Acidobacteria bacterium]|nr:hypothetical protein [Acidobacteriota bacterium]
MAEWNERNVRIPAQRVLSAGEAMLDEATEYVAERRRTMIFAVRDRLRAERRHLGAMRQRLALQGGYIMNSASQLLVSTRQLLGAYDPKKRLAQGWAIVTTSEGGVVRALGDVRVGETVRVMVSDGTFDSVVSEKGGKTS